MYGNIAHPFTVFHSIRTSVTSSYNGIYSVSADTQVQESLSGGEKTVSGHL
jgi:hypothetical protein